MKPELQILSLKILQPLADSSEPEQISQGYLVIVRLSIPNCDQDLRFLGLQALTMIFIVSITHLGILDNGSRS